MICYSCLMRNRGCSLNKNAQSTRGVAPLVGLGGRDQNTGGGLECQTRGSESLLRASPWHLGQGGAVQRPPRGLHWEGRAIRTVAP